MLKVSAVILINTEPNLELDPQEVPESDLRDIVDNVLVIEQVSALNIRWSGWNRHIGLHSCQSATAENEGNSN